MKRVIQLPLAVMALLLALVVGPETHVHQGEGSNRETVVHIHFGTAGHVHGSSSSGPSLSGSDANGAAVYLNAYSSIETPAAAVPILIPQPVRLFAPVFSAEVEFHPCSKPGDESIRTESVKNTSSFMSLQRDCPANPLTFPFPVEIAE